MQFEKTTIPDVILVRPTVFGDERGFFLEAWQQRRFGEAGVGPHFVQDNHSRSIQHTLRGLHYQLRQPQGKLVRVVAGEVFDVAVDVRRSSPTFGKWVGAVLSESNHCELWIPPGFAHGFLVLSESADFLYKVTDFYNRGDEVCIRWDDPNIAVSWPLPVGAAPLLSDKDAKGLTIAEANVFP